MYTYNNLELDISLNNNELKIICYYNNKLYKSKFLQSSFINIRLANIYEILTDYFEHKLNGEIVDLKISDDNILIKININDTKKCELILPLCPDNKVLLRKRIQNMESELGELSKIISRTKNTYLDGVKLDNIHSCDEVISIIIDCVVYTPSKIIINGIVQTGVNIEDDSHEYLHINILKNITKFYNLECLILRQNNTQPLCYPINTAKNLHVLSFDFLSKLAHLPLKIVIINGKSMIDDIINYRNNIVNVPHQIVFPATTSEYFYEIDVLKIESIKFYVYRSTNIIVYDDMVVYNCEDNKNYGIFWASELQKIIYESCNMKKLYIKFSHHDYNYNERIKQTISTINTILLDKLQLHNSHLEELDIIHNNVRDNDMINKYYSTKVDTQPITQYSIKPLIRKFAGIRTVNPYKVQNIIPFSELTSIEIKYNQDYASSRDYMIAHGNIPCCCGCGEMYMEDHCMYINGKCIHFIDNESQIVLYKLNWKFNIMLYILNLYSLKKLQKLCIKVSFGSGDCSSFLEQWDIENILDDIIKIVPIEDYNINIKLAQHEYTTCYLRKLQIHHKNIERIKHKE